jgi:hypothetical protein
MQAMPAGDQSFHQPESLHHEQLLLNGSVRVPQIAKDVQFGRIDSG